MTPSASTSSTISDADSLQLLRRFTYTSILSEDTAARTVILLGTFSQSLDGIGQDVPALLSIERQSLPHEALATLVQDLKNVQNLLVNDIYHLFVGWSGGQAAVSADLKLTLTQPATEKHIRKYAKQTYKMVRETPQLYEAVVKPYIGSLPANRVQWVYNILAHKTESENIVFEDPDPEQGFILLPDLKWDQKNASMLYLQAIVHIRSITCIRDIEPKHLPLLRNIRRNAAEAAKAKYGVEAGELRMFVHYQPSFYHFHVHVVHIQCHGYAGSTIGQAHLLDSIIDNLEQEAEMPAHPSEKSYYARRTLTYGLGDQHDLFPRLWEATAAIQDEGNAQQ